MDTLFTTAVIINGQSKSYNVSFENEAYVFKGDDGTPAFKLRREDDEWKLDGELSDISRQQATSALDHYLLSQH